MKRLISILICLLLLSVCAVAEDTLISTSITNEFTFQLPEGYFHLSADAAAQITDDTTPADAASLFGISEAAAQQLLAEENAGAFSDFDMLISDDAGSTLMISLLYGDAGFPPDIEEIADGLLENVSASYRDMAIAAELEYLGKLPTGESAVDWYGVRVTEAEGVTCHVVAAMDSRLLTGSLFNVPEADMLSILSSVEPVATEPPAAISLEGMETFTSHYDRYSISLPQGSVQFSVQEAANMLGSTPASMRFDEIDCYGIASGEMINMQTMSTPFGSIFRSDMENYGDSLVASFADNYVQMGYPKDQLDIAMETIGAYPFVRVNLVNDPSDITEYYTYGSSGTEFVFAFLGTTPEQEQAILATLQLAEPTVVSADLTEATLADKAKKRIARPEKDPFQKQTFTSHTERYKITLPGEAVHFSDDLISAHYEMSTVELKVLGLDCYSIHDNDYISMESYITSYTGIYPATLTKSGDEILKDVLDDYSEANYIDQSTLTGKIVTIGNLDFIFVECVMEDNTGITLQSTDYITYDENGTEFYFCFYDVPVEESDAIMATLEILPLEQRESMTKTGLAVHADGQNKKQSSETDDGKSSGLTDRAKDRTNAAKSDADPQKSDSGEKTRSRFFPDSSGQLLHTSAEHDYSITLPADLEPASELEKQISWKLGYWQAKSEGRDTELWDTQEETGLTYDAYTNPYGLRGITLYVKYVPDDSREEILSHSDEPLKESREAMKKQNLNPDDYLIQYEEIGGNTFYAVHGELYDQSYSEFITTGENGVQYNVLFLGFTPDEARAIMETFTIAK